MPRSWSAIPITKGSISDVQFTFIYRLVPWAVEVPGRLNHEKTHSTWRDRWSCIIECDTFLTSNVAKKCRALSRQRWGPSRKTANCNERCRRAPKGSSKGISPRTLLLLLAAGPIPAFSRSSAPADHSSPWPVAPSQTGRGAWMVPLTRTVGVSTDRELVRDAMQPR